MIVLTSVSWGTELSVFLMLHQPSKFLSLTTSQTFLTGVHEVIHFQKENAPN